MKCILLCAGYATRLFPLTENFPKALLEIEDGKPLLDYILEEVNSVSVIDEIYVVTNDRYASHFEKWANLKNNPKKITVINDKAARRRRTYSATDINQKNDICADKGRSPNTFISYSLFKTVLFIPDCA